MCAPFTHALASQISNHPFGQRHALLGSPSGSLLTTR